MELVRMSKNIYKYELLWTYRLTVVVRQVQQNSYHCPHAVFHSFAHITEAAVRQHGTRGRQGAVVQRPAVTLDHILTVTQGSEEEQGQR